MSHGLLSPRSLNGKLSELEDQGLLAFRDVLFGLIDFPILPSSLRSFPSFAIILSLLRVLR